MSTTSKLYGTPKHATHTNGTAATATVTGVAGTVSFICDVSASSDKAGSVILVKDGTTVIWQSQVGAGHYEKSFEPPLACTSGADATVTIDSTSAGYANINVVQA